MLTPEMAETSFKASARHHKIRFASVHDSRDHLQLYCACAIKGRWATCAEVIETSSLQPNRRFFHGYYTSLKKNTKKPMLVIYVHD